MALRVIFARRVPQASLALAVALVALVLQPALAADAVGRAGRLDGGPLGFLDGMLLALALFNLMLFVMLRQRAYLLYSLSMLAMIAFQTVSGALARESAYVVYFVLLVGFVRSFLDLRRIAPRTDAFVLAALALLALDAVLSVALRTRGVLASPWPALDALCVAIMLAALLAAGVVALRHDVGAARPYAVGFAGLAFGIAVEELGESGFVTLTVWGDLASAIGAVWGAVFLAFALADRIRIAEREAARLSDFAYRDQLTGIGNRRAFDETLANEWRRGSRSSRPLSLLIADIDNFKRYNDRYGHPQGDVALRMVAQEIERSARRPGDSVSRFGGEEFAVILAETGRAGALATAETLRRAVRALGLGPDDGPLTISVGVATIVPDDDETPQTLVARADAALYEAKGAGRDRTIAARTAGGDATC